MSRKEKRKAMKKMKRKEVAEKEREDAEAKLNDPAEQEKLKEIEEEEAKKRDKESKEFEDSERAWREAMEGNEIILRKNKVKVPKKPVAAQVDVNEIVDRPTSNPLPPGIEAFSKYQNFSSAQQILDTEQDKAHCPFHLKTGACRFGPRCSRVHFHPDKSCTILMKNMYNGPGIAWEQEDEGLEYTDEEAEHFYEEFYEDVTEFQKYGELINFKTCSRGSACNFIHGFLNPGGDYEWADHDKPPPRFWIRKMTALFGYSDEYVKHMEFEYSGSLTDFRSDQPTDSHRQLSRRSRSRDHDHVNVGSKPCHRNSKNHCDSTRGHKLSRHEEKRHGGDESPTSTRDGSLEKEIYKERRYAKETTRHESKWSEHSHGQRVMKKRINGRYPVDDSPDGDDDGRGETGHRRKSSKRHGRRGSDSETQERLEDEEDTRTHWSSSDRRARREEHREGSSE
ncbi:unnamed protein product [Brassica napus]|uniref:(rape) hypothetical protein n=1 Tax=Brassica napus TaxID=3708 RepID=A0A816SKY3_BRANA|nr:unnamed protein product [Brassica napus]